MTSIDSVRLALEDLASSLGLDMQELAQRREPQTAKAGNAAAPRPDSVDITPNTLRKLQASLGQEEPISREEALDALRNVRSAETEQLSQVHGGLDPARVYALLGLDD